MRTTERRYPHRAARKRNQQRRAIARATGRTGHEGRHLRRGHRARHLACGGGPWRVGCVVSPADRAAIGDAIRGLANMPEGSREAVAALDRLQRVIYGQRFHSTQAETVQAIVAAMRDSFAAGIAEGRAQAKREELVKWCSGCSCSPCQREGRGIRRPLFAARKEYLATLERATKADLAAGTDRPRTKEEEESDAMNAILSREAADTAFGVFARMAAEDGLTAMLDGSMRPL